MRQLLLQQFISRNINLLLYSFSMFRIHVNRFRDSFIFSSHDISFSSSVEYFLNRPIFRKELILKNILALNTSLLVIFVKVQVLLSPHYYKHNIVSAVVVLPLYRFDCITISHCVSTTYLVEPRHRLFNVVKQANI